MKQWTHVSVDPNLSELGIPVKTESSHTDHRWVSNNSEFLNLIESSAPKNGAFGAYSYHKNYLEYLNKCYNFHWSPVICPEILWYTVLCEISGAVQNNPEKYREFFTDSKGKSNIYVASGSPEEFDVDEFCRILSQEIHIDATMFDLEFSTDNKNSKFARKLAFMDTCSPYYEYFTYACGFPSVLIFGTESDYDKIDHNLGRLALVFEDLADYLLGVQSRIRKMLKADDPEFWKLMYKSERCGSGSQFEVEGWFLNDFYIKDTRRTKRLGSFPSHVSSVKFTHTSTNQKFRVAAGCFYSEFMDEPRCLYPKFSHQKFEISHQKPEDSGIKVIAYSQDRKFIGE